MEVAILISVIWASIHWGGEPEPIVVQEPPSVMSEMPIYEKGRFYRSEHGYLVSDLSPALEEAEGCDSPILTADLSQEYSEGEREVFAVNVRCGTR